MNRKQQNKKWMKEKQKGEWVQENKYINKWIDQK